MDLTIVCFLAIVQFYFCAGDPVVGGKDAVTVKGEKIETDTPFIVRVTVRGMQCKNGLPHFVSCGGVLIRNDAVLTAAHCLTWSVDTPQVLVTAGISHLHKESNISQRAFLKDFHFHENYTEEKTFQNFSRVFLQHDIAIIYLDKSLDITEKLKHSELIDAGVNIENRTGFIYGWGDSENEEFPHMLQKGEMRVISLKVCKSIHPRLHLTDDMLCALSDNKKVSACFGDGGGPLVIDNKVVGLMSFMSTYNKRTRNGTVVTCDPRKPSILTNIGAYRKWIESNLELGPPKDRKPLQSGNNSNNLESNWIILSFLFYFLYIIY